MQDVIKNIPSSDWDLSLKLAVGNKELATKLFNMMIASLPTEQQLIQNALDSDNFATLKQLVHKLHGGCCYTGLPRLKYIAKQLEIEIANNNTQQIVNYTNILNQEIGNLIAENQPI